MSRARQIKRRRKAAAPQDTPLLWAIWKNDAWVGDHGGVLVFDANSLERGAALAQDLGDCEYRPYLMMSDVFAQLAGKIKEAAGFIPTHLKRLVNSMEGNNENVA